MVAADRLYNFLTNPKVNKDKKVGMALFLHEKGAVDARAIKEQIHNGTNNSVDGPDIEELGFYGNVWVRKRTYKKEGDRNQGHKHNHDHVSLIAGKMMCYVKGHEPVVIENTFHIVPANFEHYFVALEDNCQVFCVYAMHDVDGEEIDLYGPNNVPWRVKTVDMA